MFLFIFSNFYYILHLLPFISFFIGCALGGWFATVDEIYGFLYYLIE